MPTWSETFLRCLVDIKGALRGDISIQETCWHSYQTSKSLVSFRKGLMRVMEMLKGMLAPKYHKRMRGYEHALTERLKGRESLIKKKKKRGKHWNAFSGETERGRGGSARLHFRLRSTELKGGPCTNETQFHATLSLPVLFPGFHFH